MVVVPALKVSSTTPVTVASSRCCVREPSVTAIVTISPIALSGSAKPSGSTRETGIATSGSSDEPDGSDPAAICSFCPGTVFSTAVTYGVPSSPYRMKSAETPLVGSTRSTPSICSSSAMSSGVIATTPVVAPGAPSGAPGTVVSTTSGSYSSGSSPKPVGAVSLALVAVSTPSAPIAATVSSMNRPTPVPRPLVTVRVKAPMNTASTVSSVRVLARNEFCTADEMRLDVLTSSPPRRRRPRRGCAGAGRSGRRDRDRASRG